MHQPSSSPRPSLYYRYQVHAPWCPPAAPTRERHRVLVVGAGPAGLVTALTLARMGVPSVVLNAELQVSQGSRAIAFTRRSLEILQQVGVAQRLSAIGLPWRYGNAFFRGQAVFRMEMPQHEDERHPPLTNVQQPFLEEYLFDACAAEPLIDLRWGNKLVALASRPDGVQAEIDTPTGHYQVDADWLVAADGGRSDTRSLLGLKLEGTSYESRFVIADIRVDLPFPTERRAYFDPDWNPGNTILMHREPLGLWRLDYQLGAEEDAEHALRPEVLAQCIDAQLAMIGHAGQTWTLDWCSVYSARTLTLPCYVHDRVVFCGDAAHLLPIFGVRGANTAFQDAQSLGWQLACVVQGWAGPSLLAQYSAERVGAAREIIDEAGKSTRFMAPPTRGFRLLRDAVLSLSLTQAFVRPLYHWRTSRPHAYRGSALNCSGDDDARFTAGPGHGEPAPDVRLGDGAHLLDHLGIAFQLLLFQTDAAPLPEAVLAEVRAARARGLPLRITTIGSGRAVEGADVCLADVDQRVRRRWGVTQDGAAYLLRPDQHVCARWLRLGAEGLREALAAALPRD